MKNFERQKKSGVRGPDYFVKILTVLKRLKFFTGISVFLFCLTEYNLPARIPAQLLDRATLMDKQIGIGMVVLAVVLLIASLMTIGHADGRQWFPLLILGVVALGWFGYKRIRWS
jgi:hypothetical protein